MSIISVTSVARNSPKMGDWNIKKLDYYTKRSNLILGKLPGILVLLKFTQFSKSHLR